MHEFMVRLLGSIRVWTPKSAPDPQVQFGRSVDTVLRTVTQQALNAVSNAKFNCGGGLGKLFYKEFYRPIPNHCSTMYGKFG
jgi:hypothetical protein